MAACLESHPAAGTGNWAGHRPEAEEMAGRLARLEEEGTAGRLVLRRRFLEVGSAGEACCSRLGRR